MHAHFKVYLLTEVLNNNNTCLSVFTIIFTVTHIYLLTTFLQTSFPYLVLYFDVKKHDMELCFVFLGAGLLCLSISQSLFTTWNVTCVTWPRLRCFFLLHILFKAVTLSLTRLGLCLPRLTMSDRTAIFASVIPQCITRSAKAYSLLLQMRPNENRCRM